MIPAHAAGDTLCCVTDPSYPASGSSHSVVWIDATAGVSGGMLLGALVGAGAPVGVLADAMDKVAPGEVLLDVEDVRRGDDVLATRCRVEVPDTTTQRTWREVERLIGGAGLHEDVRSLTHDVFCRLAEAEGEVHRQPVEDVHLRESGTLDAIADVVGVCAAVVHLGVDRIVCSEVSVGGATVSSGKDAPPVPPPAVVELLRGVPGSGAPGALGLCTPVGAALLTTLADGWGPQPAMSLSNVGVGASAGDPDEAVTVLRLVIGVLTTDVDGD